MIIIISGGGGGGGGMVCWFQTSVKLINQTSGLKVRSFWPPISPVLESLMHNTKLSSEPVFFLPLPRLHFFPLIFRWHRGFDLLTFGFG